jgi:phage-related protein
MIRIRNMRKGRNSTQVFRDLINEIERAKKLKENQKEQKLRSRLVHLYSYLSEEEKKPLKKYMERYIN